MALLKQVTWGLGECALLSILNVIYCHNSFNNYISTYSWWGAFLGNKNKIVTAHNKTLSHLVEYLLPEWILVE